MSETQASTKAAALDQNPSARGPIRVICGANEQVFPDLFGRTVGSVKASLKEVFNISKDSQIRVNGNLENENYVLKSNDQVEFVRSVGQKG